MTTRDLVVRFKNIPPGAEADIPAALEGADIVFIAESQHRRMVNHVPTASWRVLQGPGAKGRVACLIRKGRHIRVFHWDTPVLNESFGLTFPAAKRYSAIIGFQDMETGRYGNIEGDHFVPHADDDHRAGVLTKNPRIQNVLAAVASGIKRLPARLLGFEMIVGDLNVDLDQDLAIHDNGLIERYNRAGFRSDVQLLGPVHDTHGSNEYDWILLRFVGAVKTWTKQGSRFQLVAHGTGPKMRSDHRDRWVRIRLTVRKGWKPVA